MKKKSNNQKKPEWYGSMSEDLMLRTLRHQGILSWFDVYLPDKAHIIAAEQDILGFINRECRALRILIKNK